MCSSSDKYLREFPPTCLLLPCATLPWSLSTFRWIPVFDTFCIMLKTSKMMMPPSKPVTYIVAYHTFIGHTVPVPAYRHYCSSVKHIMYNNPFHFFVSPFTVRCCSSYRQPSKLNYVSFLANCNVLVFTLVRLGLVVQYLLQSTPIHQYSNLR